MPGSAIIWRVFLPVPTVRCHCSCSQVGVPLAIVAMTTVLGLPLKNSGKDWVSSVHCCSGCLLCSVLHLPACLWFSLVLICATRSSYPHHPQAAPYINLHTPQWSLRSCFLTPACFLSLPNLFLLQVSAGSQQGLFLPCPCSSGDRCAARL